jgi:hypothetical protein
LAKGLRTDARLLAEVWLNYGLACERLGLRKSAKDAFYRANALSSTTQGAKDALERGADAKNDGCPLTPSISRSPPDFSFDGWLAAYEKLEEEPSAPTRKTDVEAKQALSSGCALESKGDPFATLWPNRSAKLRSSRAMRGSSSSVVRGT